MGVVPDFSVEEGPSVELSSLTAETVASPVDFAPLPDFELASVGGWLEGHCQWRCNNRCDQRHDDKSGEVRVDKTLACRPMFYLESAENLGRVFGTYKHDEFDQSFTTH